MVLQELILKDFGKFHNKKITLSPSINLIYGENEAGKTTVHSFIRGMILGIDKSRGRESKDDLYSKYLPWNTPTLYSGVMKVESEGKHYLIERNFYKDNKYLKITDLETGREQYGEAGQIPFLFRNVTKTTYRNTISLEQNKSATDKELEVEIRNYIANLTTSKSSEVDINSALQKLYEKKKNLNIKSTEEEIKSIEHKLGQLDTLKLKMNAIENQIKYETKQDSKKEVEAKNKKSIGPFFLGFGGLVLFVIGLLTKLLLLCGLSMLILILMCIILLIKERTKNEELKTNSQVLVQKERLHWNLEQMEEEVIQLEALQDTLNEQKAKFSAAYENLAAIELAIDTIEKLSTEIHNGFGKKFNDQISAIAADVTGGTYKKVYVDEKLNIKVNVQDRIVPLNQLSAGTMDQLYLALRFTAADLLLNGEKYPIILDDSFTMYDDKRFESVLNMLSEQNRQIIIFTCHRREKEIFNKIKTLYHYIEL